MKSETQNRAYYGAPWRPDLGKWILNREGIKGA